MDSKSVSTLDIDIPVVSVGGSSGVDLVSGPRQIIDEECRDHDVCEQPPLPAKSLITGVNQRLEDEPGFSLPENLKHRATNDLHDVSTNMKDVEKIHEQAAHTEVVGSANVQEVHEELVFDSAKHLEHKAMNDLRDVGKKMGKVEEVCEQAANNEVVGSPDEQELGQELVSDSTKHLEHRATNDFHDVGTKMEDEQEVYQELVSDSAKHLEHRATNILHDVGTKMEDVEEAHEQAANAEVVGSPDEHEVDQELISDSTKHLEHRSADDFHDVGAEMEDVEGVHEQAVNTEIVGSPDEQELYQELVSDSAKHLENRATNNLHDVDTNMEDIEEAHDANTEEVGSLDEEVDQELVSDSAKHLEHRATNDSHDVGTNVENVEEIHEPAANTEVVGSPDEQGVCPELISDSAKHQEHRVTNDLHDFGTNMEDVEEVQQAVNTEVVGSPDEQEINQELVSDTAKHLEHRATNNLHDVGTGMEDVEEVHEQAANTEAVGSLDEQERDQDLVSDSAKHLEHRATNDLHDVGTKMENVEGLHEQDAKNEVVGSPDEQVDQQSVSDSAKPQKKEEKSVKHLSPKPGSLIKDCRVRYQLPPENESEFAVFDLVWGKVKSHPWWPGQIFHPSDSSEKAMKYYKKDCYLVAYFGDRTFAWNDASVLKPFRNHFSQAERQNKTEAFQNAVSCALEEVTRRVELGLACSCVPEDAYDKIKYQLVENSGIKEESSKREGVDRSTGADSLQPDKLTEYVKALAVFPTSGFDRLELVTAKAQLLAFNQLRGCDALPEFQYYEGLEYSTDTLPGNQGLSDDNEPVTGVDGKKGPRKRKHNLKDIVYQRRKEKSMTDLMGESMYCLDGEFDSHEEDDIFLASPTAGSKQKGGDFLADDFTAPQSTKSISVAKVSRKTSPSPQQSFKVGECIRRVASQMTGSSIIIKDCCEESNKYAGDDADDVLESHNNSLTEETPISADKSSLDEMLSLLHLSAQNPMKRYSYFGEIIRFFSEFRNLAVTTQRQRMRKGSCRKKKSSAPVVAPPENFEFDDRNDSYWRDMVVQDHAEVKPARRGRKRKDEQGLSTNHQKPLQRKPRKYSRKQYHNGNHESVPVPEMPPADEKQLNLPAELMMNFGETTSVPSEVSLNKMFKRFGPLKESETEVDMQNSRARVVFKKRSDAEVAYSSAAMFNIFGSTLVNYQLNYTPLVSFRSSSLALTNGKEDAS